MSYSVSAEAIRGKTFNDYKTQWEKDKASLELFKHNIEQFNIRTNLIILRKVDERLSKPRSRRDDRFLEDIKSELEKDGDKHKPLSFDFLEEHKHLSNFSSIIALLNNRNNFCLVYEKVSSYLKKGSENPGSISINNVASLIFAYSNATSAESFMEMVNHYPIAINDFRNFLTEIEARSKFMTDFVSNSPTEHRIYEILNEMNTKIFWYQSFNGMTEIYGRASSFDSVLQLLKGSPLSPLKLLNSIITNRSIEGFSEEKLKETVFKFFKKKLSEADFLSYVIELVELNPDLDLKILSPYVAELLEEKNFSIHYPLIKNYYENILEPFVKYIKERNLEFLKTEIINNISNPEKTYKFADSVSKTDLALLEEKIEIILKRTDTEISALNLDDNAFNYFIQDKFSWLPNHVSHAKSAFITKRLKRHHELVEVKKTLSEIAENSKDKLGIRKEKIEKLKELYNKVSSREEQSLKQLFKEEFEGINYILNLDIKDNKGKNSEGLDALKVLSKDILNIINSESLQNNKQALIDLLDIFIKDLEYKIEQSEKLVNSDPNIIKLKSIHNSVTNLKSYLSEDYSLKGVKEKYCNLPIELTPYSRYVHEKNNERKQKNWEQKHKVTIESLNDNVQSYSDYLIKMNALVFSNNANLRKTAEMSEKILKENKDKKDISLESTYNNLSELTDDRMQLMMMYSAGKMQVFAKKLADVLNITEANKDISSDSNPISFFAKHVKQELFNNPFGMFNNLYILNRMRSYTRFLTDFSNHEPQKYRTYEIINHHASAAMSQSIKNKFLKVYKEDILSIIKKTKISDSISDYFKNRKTKELLIDLGVHLLTDKIKNLDVEKITVDTIKDALNGIIKNNTKINSGLPVSETYGENSTPQDWESFLINAVSSYIDGLDSEILPFNEDEIINHIIELQDLSRETGVYVTPEIIREILSRYNKKYADDKSEEYKAFNKIFISNEPLSSSQELKDLNFLYKLKQINKASSILDNNAIIKILSIKYLDGANFSNQNPDVSNIYHGIPGTEYCEKINVLIEILQRRMSYVLENTNEHSTSIDPEAPVFNYFAQENMVYLPIRNTGVISADLAKRFKKHSEILDNIKTLEEVLSTKQLLAKERNELKKTKDKLSLVKETFLGLILQDEFIGINRILDEIKDDNLSDLKKEAKSIEELLKQYMENKNKKIGDFKQILSKVENFNSNKILEKVIDSKCTSLANSNKISGILLSFNLCTKYFAAVKSFDSSKDFKNSFSFLDSESTIEKSDYKIAFTTMDKLKLVTYELQKLLINLASFAVYKSYDIVFKKILFPVINAVSLISNDDKILFGNYDTSEEGSEYLNFREKNPDFKYDSLIEMISDNDPYSFVDQDSEQDVVPGDGIDSGSKDSFTSECKSTGFFTSYCGVFRKAPESLQNIGSALKSSIFPAKKSPN